jgi:hypothetical protein
VFNYGANHGVPDIEIDDTFVGEADFLGIALYLLRSLRRNLHPELYLPLLAIFLQCNTMVVLGIPLDSNGGGVEFFRPEFLYLLDLMLEVLILILREHVLEFIVEFLLAILHIDFEGITIEGVGVGVSEFLSLEHAVLCLFVGFYYSEILGHFSGVHWYCLVVDDTLLDSG